MVAQFHCQRILHFNTLGSPSKVEIKSATETSITGSESLRKMKQLAVELDGMEIKTFRVMFGPAV